MFYFGKSLVINHLKTFSFWCRMAVKDLTVQYICVSNHAVTTRCICLHILCWRIASAQLQQYMCMHSLYFNSHAQEHFSDSLTTVYCWLSSVCMLIHNSYVYLFSNHDFEMFCGKQICTACIQDIIPWVHRIKGTVVDQEHPLCFIGVCMFVFLN